MTARVFKENSSTYLNTKHWKTEKGNTDGY